MRYFKYIRKPVIIQIVFSFLYTMAIAVIPYLHKLLFDTVGKGEYDNLKYLAIYYVMAIFASAIFQYISQTHEWKTITDFFISLKEIVFNTFLKYKSPRFKEKTVGEYISILDNDVNELQQLKLEGIIDIIKSANMLMIYTVALIYFVDIRIALVIIISSLVSAFVPKLTSKKLSFKKKKYLKHLGEYINYTDDFFKGHASLDLDSKEKICQVHYNNLLKMEKSRLEFGSFKTFTNITNGFVMDIISLSSFIMVGYLLMKGEITIGTGVATFSYIESFIYPIKYILNDINAINASKEVDKSISAVIDEGESSEKELIEYDIPMKIEFKNVNVQRGDFKLKDFSYTFNAGKKYVITGSSGSGKSTILSLIKGEILPESGEVLLNGIPIEEDSIKKITAGIYQQDHVFYADYHSNCSLFDTYKPDYEKIESQFKSSFIKRIKNMEDCRDLSGGEKQILLLMRSHASKKRIILLDEVFTSIDMFNRDDARKFIFGADAQIFISVTHDISEENLKNYDEIMIIKNGEILNSGTYDEYVRISYQ